MEREFDRNHRLSNGYFGSFTMAPLSSLALAGSISSFFITRIHSAMFPPLAEVNVENIIMRRELWKLLISKFYVTDPKQIILTVILILHFKKFEKRYGSRKFASYLCSVFLISLLFELALLYLSSKRHWGLASLPNGPLAVIFSLFVPFYFDIPRIVRAAVIGIPVSGKAIAYICGLQISSSSLESLCVSLIGIAAGGLFRSNFLFLKKYFMIPKIIGTICHKLFSPLLWEVDKVTRTNYGATLELQHLEEEERIEQAMIRATMRIQGNQNAHAGRSLRTWLMGRGAAVVPAEDKVLTLTNMGFNREQAAQALRLYNNDLAQATNHLLAANR
ncbi:ubiquitin-associated domain-containing protein 2-like [Watersipora subatra]|uniref:ubiquitin-associated domain-containing protein 2-like n=1 Tax=Watersipora subatra TaxID=2589382 RepID=UPI00355AD02B